MFKRKIYDKLIDWKEESAGRNALLIEGARRVGKTTVVEEFAKKEYRSYIFIDFSVASAGIKKLFDDISDLNYFFLQLQLFYKTELYVRNSLIVFDEVQRCPLARQAIKYLVKDGRYDFIETGSLISIKKNVKDILIPSEERHIYMYPLDYEEFLWALGDSVSPQLIKDAYEKKKPLGDALNRKLMRSFRLYMLVGGMPQAVSTYLETNNLQYVDQIKRDILRLYDEDFSKIDSTNRIAQMFDAIPAQLNNNASRYQVSSVLENERSSSILSLIAEMNASGTVLVSYHANDPNVGLVANMNIEKFKLYICDTGLFTTLMFKDRSFTENDIYAKLLNDKMNTNLGYLYENVVAQILTAKGDRLFYYTFLSEESSHFNEIDFILTRKTKICPIEVKSSGYKTHVSFDRFSNKFSERIMERYIVYTKDYHKEGNLIFLPVYMLPFIDNYV